MGCLGETQDGDGNRISTPSTPPAWHFLHECDVPERLAELSKLSIHSRNLPVSATLREQNDSDQCGECRCAPNAVHNAECDGAAKLTDSVTCADERRTKSPVDAPNEHPSWVCFDCGRDRYGMLDTIGATWRMDTCGICGETEAVTEPRDFGGHRLAAGKNPFSGPLYDIVEDAAAHLSCPEPETTSPADSYVESCPECGTVTDIDYGDLSQVTEAGLSNPLSAHMWETFNQCLAISRRKNADYATDSDPLANFRACQQFGVPLTKGIMVRLSDKFARIGNLLDREAQVKDEAIADSIMDAIDYLAILLYALETE